MMYGAAMPPPAQYITGPPPTQMPSPVSMSTIPPPPHYGQPCKLSHSSINML